MKKKILIVLTLCLILYSSLSIILQGNKYTVVFNVSDSVEKLEDVEIQVEDESIINYSDVKLKDGSLYIKTKAVSKGSTFLNVINKGENIALAKLYVHYFNVITFNRYFGEATGSKSIPIAITILLAYILVCTILVYRKSIKNNMYQYKNVLYLGLIIFLSFTFLNQVLTVFIDVYYGLNQTIQEFINMYNLFSFVLLPITFITSILIIISVGVLIKREGYSTNKLAGLALGIFLCYSTMFPDLLYSFLLKFHWIDLYNEGGISLYLVEFVDLVIYASISYTECILLGTIILSIKSARHIPKYDKDYIVILGCKIKKDGSLPPLLKGRVDRAIEFARLQKENTNKDIMFIPSGGQGKDEVMSEAQAMKNYLLEQGIDKKNILLEDKSKNTLQNITYSNKLINDKDKKIAFSTTNYHVFRAGVLATDKKITVEGIGSKTKSYFFINAFIREFVATIVTEKKKHIKIISIIFIISAILITLLYIGNAG